MTAPRIIESLFVEGPAGRLEALFEEPDRGPVREVVLVCHPHPQHGGTMRNKVVHRLARALRHMGAAVLRFNYRGVNLSAGAYDHGIGEVEDARACWNWLVTRHPGVPRTIAGFSFGSRIALLLGCQEPAVDRVIAVGMPAAYMNDGLASRCPAQRCFIQSTGDALGPREQLQRWYDRLDPPKRILWVSARDHFFAGALDVFEETVKRL